MQHLSYAGITLPLQTPEHKAWLEQVHPQFTFKDFEGWSFEGFDLQYLPTPPLPGSPEFDVGKLYWPTGASRVAWFHAIVETARLDSIRAAVGDPMTPRSLVFNDGRTGHTVTASMYFLPPRPLNQLGHASSDAWVLTLADCRFYGQWQRGDITAIPSTWGQLIGDLAGFMGKAITIDTVDAAYQSPSEKWVTYNQPVATLLDAVLDSVGQRFVANLDGTFKTVKYTTAKTDSDSYVQGNPIVISGGFLDPTDIGKYVPSSVDIFFYRYPSTRPGDESPFINPYTVNKNLTTLAISDYGSSTGIPTATGDQYVDFAFDGSNGAACDALAVVAATDWYGWRLPDTDIVYPGIQSWVPTGWEDCVEWQIQKRADQPFANTTVRRGAWDDFVSGSWLRKIEPGFHAVLTGTNGTGWKFKRLTLSSAGSPIDDSTDADGFNAYQIDTSVSFAPSIGDVVWMIPSKRFGKFEFRGNLDTGSGGSGGNPCADCFPEGGSGGDGLDPIVVIDTLCVDGLLYVIRAKQAIIFDTSTFVIRVEYYEVTYSIEGCCDCPPAYSGSGGSGNIGEVTIPCCPDNPVSILLNVHVSDGVHTTNFPITYDTALGEWQGYFNNCCFSLVCGPDSTFGIALSNTADCAIVGPICILGLGGEMPTMNCNPFQVIFPGVTLNCCRGVFNNPVTFTIT